ncbi:MAG: hypothetical protein ACI9M6_001737 [Hydrogenophaga sp.]
MRGQDFVELARRKVAPDGEQQLVVGHVATWVDDGAALAVDHQKLVGLHGLAARVAEVGKHDAHMVVLVEKLNGHAGESGVMARRKIATQPA